MVGKYFVKAGQFDSAKKSGPSRSEVEVEPSSRCSLVGNKPRPTHHCGPMKYI